MIPRVCRPTRAFCCRDARPGRSSPVVAAGTAAATNKKRCLGRRLAAHKFHNHFTDKHLHGCRDARHHAKTGSKPGPDRSFLGLFRSFSVLSGPFRSFPIFFRSQSRSFGFQSVYADPHFSSQSAMLPKSIKNGPALRHPAIRFNYQRTLSHLSPRAALASTRQRNARMKSSDFARKFNRRRAHFSLDGRCAGKRAPAQRAFVFLSRRPSRPPSFLQNARTEVVTNAASLQSLEQ